MKLFKSHIPSKDFLYVRDIVRKYLKDPTVQKLISPQSEEYFLIDSKNGVNIEVGHGKITVSNHKFLYKQIFPLRDTEQLIKEINVEIEKERQELKKTLFSNEIDLLRNIFKL